MRLPTGYRVERTVRRGMPVNEWTLYRIDGTVVYVAAPPAGTPIIDLIRVLESLEVMADADVHGVKIP